jgi:hypothetical protein
VKFEVQKYFIRVGAYFTVVVGLLNKAEAKEEEVAIVAIVARRRLRLRECEV